MPKKPQGRRAKGKFVMVLHSMMKSAAWQDLSGNDVKLLMHLMMLSEGNNGWGHQGKSGELFLAEREAAGAIGVSRNTASSSFKSLIGHGFLRPVRPGHFHIKVRQATVWRLTFQPYPRAQQGPTNEWREWRPEEDSRAQELTVTGPNIGLISENRRSTGAKTDPVRTGNDGKKPMTVGSITEPHLDIPCVGGTPGGERHSANTPDDGNMCSETASFRPRPRG